MKIRLIKITGIALLVMAVLSLLALFTIPVFVGEKEVSLIISGRISNAIKGKTEIGSIRWAWFPFPHLIAHDVRFENDRFKATLPKMSVYPRWEVMPLGRIEPGRIGLDGPDIRIKSISGAGNTTLPVPPAHIVIRGGTLEIAPGLYPWLVKGVSLHTLNADFVTRGHGVEIKKINFGSDAIKKMDIKGAVNFKDETYTLVFDATGFAPGKAGLAPWVPGPLRPLDADIDFRLDLKGRGSDTFKAVINGDMPRCNIRKDNVTLNASSKRFAVSIDKSLGRLFVSVDRLEMDRPQFLMTGHLERKWATGGEPVWDIKFKAKDVDLKGVRQWVLILLGKYDVARNVCDIVRGGRAKEASYTFHGGTSDFKRLDAMEITADVDRAPIHVPKADLDLDEASGPIKIINGALSGDGLSAKMGDSVGSDGRLFLQISGDDNTLKLGLDIDADVSALHPILQRLVDNEAFRHELSLVNQAKGRAKGHLDVSGRLDDLDINVQVSRMNGSFVYGRIPWPIMIDNGELSVGHKEVSWKDVAGSLGRNKIHAASGSVDWQKGMLLKVDAFQADVDSGALYKELSGSAAISKVLSRVLTDITGRIFVKSATLSGPVMKPQDWKYKVGIAADALDFDSPMLPETVHVSKLKAAIDDQKVKIAALDSSIDNQPLNLTGGLSHRLLDDWHGWVEISGIARDSLLAWLKDKAWIAPKLFPKAPCAFNRFRIDVEPGSVSVKGTVMPGFTARKFSSRAVPRVDMDLAYSKGKIIAKTFDITGLDEKSSISFDLEQGRQGGFSIKWDGSLSKHTLDAILEKNTLLSGSIEGLFRLEREPSLVQPWSFDGAINVSNLYIPLHDIRPFEIKRLRLRSLGSEIEVGSVVFYLGGEAFAGHGDIAGNAMGLSLDASLKSDAVSWNNMSRIFKMLSRYSGRSELPITGRIGFDIENFQYTRNKLGCNGPECKKTTFTWHPLKGEVRILEDNAFSVSIKSADLCGLNTTGVWSKKKGPGAGVFHISSGHKKDLFFQEVLPCLGFDNEIIKGPFELDASLDGSPDKWRGGFVSLRSTDGQIRRLTLLAKVFSLLNVTDIFSGGLPDLFNEGYSYSDLDFDGRVKDGDLIVKKMTIKGRGLNIFATGSIDLDKFNSNLIFLIAPFKTIDAIISNIPILGRALGGKTGALITIPVGVNGPVRDPDVTLLPPKAVGSGILNLMKDTFKIPLYIIEPVLH